MNFDPNNVMLTSQYAFTPETYQCIGFSNKANRSAFIDRCARGAFVVVYLTRACGDPDAGCIVGVGQTNGQLGSMRNFTPLAIHRPEIAKVADKWPFALGYSRAWRITERNRMDIRDFAHVTYDPYRSARDIGVRGRLLRPEEAEKLANMDFEEVQLAR